MDNWNETRKDLVPDKQLSNEHVIVIREITNHTERELQLAFICGYMNREEWRESKSLVNAIANGELTEKWELFKTQILNKIV